MNSDSPRRLKDYLTQPASGGRYVFTLREAGAALYKLYLKPAARYSEEIDLVRVTAEPAGIMMGALREALDPWLLRTTTR